MQEKQFNPIQPLTRDLIRSVQPTLNPRQVILNQTQASPDLSPRIIWQILILKLIWVVTPDRSIMKLVIPNRRVLIPNRRVLILKPTSPTANQSYPTPERIYPTRNQMYPTEGSPIPNLTTRYTRKGRVVSPILRVPTPVLLQVLTPVLGLQMGSRISIKFRLMKIESTPFLGNHLFYYSRNLFDLKQTKRVFYLLHNSKSTCVELDTKVRLRTNQICNVILCRKITEKSKNDTFVNCITIREICDLVSLRTSNYT